MLAIIGTVAFMKRRRHRPTAPFTQDPMFATLPAILGGLLGSVSTLTIAYVAHRYIADFFPPLLILAAIGMHTLLSIRDARSIRKLAVGITAMCVAGTWISLSFAIVFQRDLACGDPDYGRGTETPVCARR